MNKIILYGHGGSGNHGCEAIVRSVNKIIGCSNPTLMSSSINQDIKYGVDDFTTPISANTIDSKLNWNFLVAYLKLKLQNEYIHLDLLPYKNHIKQLGRKSNVALSIGGDNYCYGDITIYKHLNLLYNNNKIKTAFIGCSVEPESIKHPTMIEDLKNYSLIIARESLTYEAMTNAGLNHVKLLPDPAFVLDKVELPLPNGFKENNTTV